MRVDSSEESVSVQKYIKKRKYHSKNMIVDMMPQVWQQHKAARIPLNNDMHKKGKDEKG